MTQLALEALCLRCLKSLTRYAAGRLPPAVRDMLDTQDVVLEAVQRGMSRLGDFEVRHPGALVAYMRTTLRNLIIDYLRATNTPAAARGARRPAPGSNRSPLERVLSEEQIALYDTALARLKPRDAALVTLKIDEQLSYDEIASRAGPCFGNAARVAARRAVLRLAHEMARLSQAKNDESAPRGHEGRVMRTGRDALVRAVDAVVEGTGAVDWGLITIELDNDRDRELLRQIRLLVADLRHPAHGSRMLCTRTSASCARGPTPSPACCRSKYPPRPSPDDVAAAEAPTISQDLGEPEAVARWGRLELLELVGKGTFGDVYRARDSQLQREVAVKLLHVNRRRDGLVDRMLHEARALARVEHPNVVVVHDAEERDGRAGLCMEFIRGRTLEALLATDGPRGAREAALIGQDLCQALAAVHAAGLVHRDIKAQNVMRENGGRVVLMDFGAGLQLSEGEARAGSVTGTPLYLAPEVLERGETSARSDIYSLGVLLYHLVSNDYPVRGQTPMELLDAHRNGRVRRLRDAAPKCPSWFVRAVERAIATDPRERYATAGEFEAALGGPTPLRVWPFAHRGGRVAGSSGSGAAGVVTLECARQFDAARRADASRRGTWCRTSHRGCHLGRDLPGARSGRHTPRHLAGVGGECQARSAFDGASRRSSRSLRGCVRLHLEAG